VGIDIKKGGKGWRNSKDMPHDAARAVGWEKITKKGRRNTQLTGKVFQVFTQLRPDIVPF